MSILSTLNEINDANDTNITNAKIANKEMPYKTSFIVIPATEDDFNVFIGYGQL